MKVFSRLLERVRLVLRPFLESKVFGVLFTITVAITPAAQIPQLVKALTAPSVQGISLETYTILCFTFSMLMFYGIKTRDVKIWIGMTIASVLVVSILITVLLRGGTYVFASL